MFSISDVISLSQCFSDPFMWSHGTRVRYIREANDYRGSIGVVKIRDVSSIMHVQLEISGHILEIHPADAIDLELENTVLSRCGDMVDKIHGTVLYHFFRHDQTLMNFSFRDLHFYNLPDREEFNRIMKLMRGRFPWLHIFQNGDLWSLRSLSR